VANRTEQAANRLVGAANRTENVANCVVGALAGPRDGSKGVNLAQDLHQLTRTAVNLRNTGTMKSDYVKTNKAAFGLQLNTFRDNIGPYATLLGLTAPEIASQAADADNYNYVIASLMTIDQCSQQWSMWERLIRQGGTAPSSGAPVLPTLGAAPAAVDLGIEERFRTLVRRIKAHPNYNASIGDALGIEGPEQTPVDLSTVQPRLKLKISGGVVVIGWGWGGQSEQLDMIRLEVDRGTGAGFVLLANDTTPGYFDTESFPATAAKWTYRGMYYVGDGAVGQWSDPVSINVGS
jgi:hypothetical protein